MAFPAARCPSAVRTAIARQRHVEVASSTCTWATSVRSIPSPTRRLATIRVLAQTDPAQGANPLFRRRGTPAVLELMRDRGRQHGLSTVVAESAGGLSSSRAATRAARPSRPEVRPAARSRARVAPCRCSCDSRGTAWRAARRTECRRSRQHPWRCGRAPRCVDSGIRDVVDARRVPAESEQDCLRRFGDVAEPRHPRAPARPVMLRAAEFVDAAETRCLRVRSHTERCEPRAVAHPAGASNFPWGFGLRRAGSNIAQLGVWHIHERASVCLDS